MKSAFSQHRFWRRLKFWLRVIEVGIAVIHIILAFLQLVA
jgi:hypothetical protein